jgi:hypothetical protein
VRQWREHDDQAVNRRQKAKRRFGFYYSGSTPSAVRYQNWKFYYTMTETQEGGKLGKARPVVC